MFINKGNVLSTCLRCVDFCVTVWKGSLRPHLWHRSDGLPGYIRLAESHGSVWCHPGHCCVCAGLLLAANGRPFGHQCRLVSPVSDSYCV